MLKKIICPTDFTPVSANAVEYAAKLSKLLDAELRILNVQSFFPSEVLRAGDREVEAINETSVALRDICTEVNRAFGISCDYDLEFTNSSLEKAITRKSDEYFLIVMGTNGTDDLLQFFFGSNSFHVARSSQCPVMIIPEEVIFGSVGRIVFAWDYSQENSEAILKLAGTFKRFDPEIVFLHVSQLNTRLNTETFRKSAENIRKALDFRNLRFEHVFDDDIAAAIHRYMQEGGADLLAVNYHHRGLSGFFHHSVTRDLSNLARYPIVVLPA